MFSQGWSRMLAGYVPGALRIVMHSAALGMWANLPSFSFAALCFERPYLFTQFAAIDFLTLLCVCVCFTGIIIPRMKSMAGGTDWWDCPSSSSPCCWCCCCCSTCSYGNSHLERAWVKYVFFTFSILSSQAIFLFGYPLLTAADPFLQTRI